MPRLRRFALRLYNFLRPQRAERELAREVASHLALIEDDYRRAGLNPAEARREASRIIGGVEQLKETHRDARSFMWLEDARRDLRGAIRRMRRTPAFTVTAVLTLALGIGANAAIFSAVDSMLIQPLPYAKPDRLMMIWEDAAAIGFPFNTPAPGNYTEWARLNHTFTGMAGTRGASASLTVDGPPEQIIGRMVTPNFFSVLGVQPILGRTFTDEEDRKIAPVVVIGYGLWQRRYNGDPAILNRTVWMNGAPHQIIGVMPRAFVFRNRDIEYWIPMSFTLAQASNRSAHYLNVVGRLKTGVTIEVANRDMREVSTRLQREHPETNFRVTTVVVPLKDDLLGNTRRELVVLMGAALAILLIGCANLASLYVSRAVARRQEFAMRAVLGATGGRLVRQVVVEAMAISILGGIVGLVVARLGIVLMSTFAPVGFSPLPASVLGPRLLLFVFLVSIAAGFVFSVVPAIHATRESQRDGGQQRTRTVIKGDARLTRDALVVLQVAGALALLVGTGLMLRTLANLRALELGFRSDHLLTLRTTLPPQRYADPAQRLAFYERVVKGVRALPGVEDAAYGSLLPFMSIGTTTWFQIEGVTLAPDDPPDTLFRAGTSDYLKTLGVRLVEGRLLDDRDYAGAPLAVVINETMARKYWPNEPAVGHRIRFSDPSAPFYTIVGVTKDVRERGYDIEMKPTVYFEAAHGLGVAADTLAVRVAGSPTSIASAVRRVVASVDPEQPVAAVRTMEEIVDLTVADRRQQLVLLAAFAGLALLLASIGLYGVLSYTVAQRTREFGVRIALGASRRSVVQMVVARGASLTATGLAIGLVLAWTVTRTMESLLYGVTPVDSLTFAGVISVIGSIGVFACYVPARRAARLDPAVTLRYE